MKWVIKALAVLLVLSSPLKAEELSKPLNPVVLSVSGKVSYSNSESGVDFDLRMLQSLPQREIRTINPWVDSMHSYTGPALSEVLDFVGAKGTTLVLTALNDYQVTIDFNQLKDYHPILAWQDNGEPMSVRDKGPLWLMLPISDHKELLRLRYNDYMIWQLRYIEVK